MSENVVNRGHRLPVIGRLWQRYDFEIYLLRRNPMTMLGLVIIIIILIAAIFAPLLAPYDPLEVNPIDRLQAPSLQHIMGTDEYGRDIFSRVLYASRIDLTIAISAVTAAALIGTALGAIGGYFRGKGFSRWNGSRCHPQFQA